MPVPDSITLRTSLLFSLLTAAVVFLMGMVVRISVDHHFVKMDSTQMEGKLELIRHILADSRAPSDLPDIHKQLEEALIGHHDLVVRINDNTGSVFFSSGHAEVPLDTQKIIPNETLQWSVDGADFRGVSSKTSNGFLIVVGTDISHHQEFLNQFESQLLEIGICGAMAMAILGWFAARRGLKPLQDMANIATGISAQQLQERLPRDNVPVELQALTDSFNAMLDRLGSSLERLSEFSTDLAHELRTPINNLMTQTQVSLSKQRNSDDYREILYANLDEYERLARMISDMLFLAKADRGLVIPSAEIVNLRAEFLALCEFYEVVAAEKLVDFSINGEASIHGDKLMLHRAFGNLLENAIRHSHTNSTIKIKLEASSLATNIVIENTGDTISHEQLPRLFDRFYRADASRQCNDEGAGLGLAITQSIIKAHAGNINVSSENGVTKFDVIFTKV